MSEKISDADLAVMKAKIDGIHAALFGTDSKPGMKEKFDKLEGGISVFKWMAGSGGIAGIVALIVTMMGFM